MSGRTILVLLAVSLLLVQSKPAPIEESATKVQAVDNLLNQLQQQETSSNATTKSQVQTSSSTERQQTIINGLLQNRSFLDQIAEFFQRLEQMYEYLIHGQSGSFQQDSQSTQTSESSQTHSASNNSNHATLRGLFDNPSFLNFLSIFLPNIQGTTPFSHLSDYNAASHNQQNGEAQSHVSNAQSTQQSAGSTSSNQAILRGLFNNPAFLNFLSGFLQSNHGSSFSHNQQTGGSQSHVSNSQFDQNTASANHFETAGTHNVVSDVATTNQHVASNAVVNNAASSNTASSNNAQESIVFVGKPAIVVVPSQNANAITTSSNNHQVSSVVVDDAAATSQHDYVFNGHSGPVFANVADIVPSETFTASSDNVHQVPSIVFPKPAVIAVPGIVPSYNADVVDIVPAPSNNVINGHSRPVPAIVSAQNTATNTASVVSSQSSSSNGVQASNIYSDNYVSSGEAQIQTEHPINDASSQISNHQQSLDEEAVQSKEALLKQLLTEINSQSAQAIQADGGSVDTFNTAQSNGQQDIVNGQQYQASTSQNSASSSEELHNNINDFSVPKVPSLNNIDAFNTIQTNEQQQIVTSNQQQASTSHTSASSSSGTLLENSNFNTVSVAPVVFQKPIWPSQVNGVIVPKIQVPLGSNVNSFNIDQTNGQHQIVTSQQQQSSTSQNSASTSSEAILEDLQKEFSVPQVQVPSVHNVDKYNNIKTNGQQQVVASQQHQASTSHTSASSSSGALLGNSNFNTASVAPVVYPKPTWPGQVNGIKIPLVVVPLGPTVDSFNTAQTNGQHQIVTSQKQQSSTSQNSASTSSEAILEELRKEFSVPQVQVPLVHNVDTYNTIQANGQQQVVASQQQQSSTSQNSASTSSEAILEELRKEFSVPQVQVPLVHNVGTYNTMQTNGQQQVVASQQQQASTSHTSASSSSGALFGNSNFNTASVAPVVSPKPTGPSQVNGIKIPLVVVPLGPKVNSFNTAQTNGQQQVEASQKQQSSTSQNSASTSSEAILEELRKEFSVPQVQVPLVHNVDAYNTIQTNGQQQVVASQQQQASTSHTSASSSSGTLLGNSNFNTASVAPVVSPKPTWPSQVNGIKIPLVVVPLGPTVASFNTAQTNGQHQIVTSQQQQSSSSQNSASTSYEAMLEELRNKFSVPQIQVPSVHNVDTYNTIQTNGQQQVVASQQQQSSTSQNSASTSSEAILEELRKEFSVPQVQVPSVHNVDTYNTIQTGGQQQVIASQQQQASTSHTSASSSSGALFGNSNFNTASVAPVVSPKPTGPSQVNGIKIPLVVVPLGPKVDSFNTAQTNGQQQVVASQQQQSSNSQNSASTSYEAMLEELRNKFSVPQVQVPSVHNVDTFNTIQTNGQQQVVANQQQQASSSHASASSSSEAMLEELKNSQYVRPVVPLGTSQSSSSHSRYEDEAEFKQQAQNANYQFATQVDDNINGNFQQRAEIREGTSVHGKYSYDDGFVWRTVYYVADENGYRILKEEVSPSRMTSNVNGEADVQTFNAGNLLKYHITKQDIGSSKRTNRQQYGLEGQQLQYGVANSQQ